MSEFRKYRLVTKLIDKYEVPWQPQRFLQYTAIPVSSGGEHRQDMMELSSAHWWPLVMDIQHVNPQFASKLVGFLSRLARSDLKSTDIVSQPIPFNLDPKHDNKGTQISPHVQNDGYPSRVEEAGYREPTYSLKTFANSYEWCAGNLSYALQELFIIEDFFDLVLGASGRLLTWNHAEEGNTMLLVDETLSSHLLRSIKPLIAIVYSAKMLELFIEQKDHFAGRTYESFVAALQQYLSTFRNTIAQLEKKFVSGNMRLQTLKMHVAPFERRLELLSTFVEGLLQVPASGGALLQRLEKLADQYTGDRSCRSFIESLIAQSALPFTTMLKNWLETGKLDDPYHEFMICPKHTLDTAKHEGLFSEFAVVSENAPLVLKARAQKLAQLGSYFVILHMEKDYTCHNFSVPSIPDLIFLNQRKIFQIIDSSFEKLSASIMTRMTQDRHLVDRFETCRGFYFLERTDLFGSFVDACGAELSKPASSAIWEKVVACWDSSVEACMPELEFCTMRIVKESLGLTQQLQRIIGTDTNLDTRQTESDTYLPQCIEMVCLEANFDFPYNILLDKENLSKYNILFRFLLRLVFLQSELAQMKPRQFSKQFCLLRRQMLVFLGKLHQYLVNDVIQARWKVLSEGVGNCKGLEEILTLHVEFLDSCLRQSMLTNGKLLRILNVLFCHCTRVIEISRVSPEDPGILDRVSSEAAGFGKDMLSFMEALQYFSSSDYDYHLGALFSRIDSNSVYCRIPAISYS